MKFCSFAYIYLYVAYSTSERHDFTFKRCAAQKPDLFILINNKFHFDIIFFIKKKV